MSSWPASSTMTHPPRGTWSSDRAARAAVSPPTSRAAPRLAAASAVGATASTRSAPTAAATRLSISVLPAPAGPSTSTPWVAELRMVSTAAAWSPPSPAVSTSAAAAAAGWASEASQDTAATSAEASPVEYQRPSRSTKRLVARSHSSVASRPSSASTSMFWPSRAAPALRVAQRVRRMSGRDNPLDACPSCSNCATTASATAVGAAWPPRDSTSSARS